MCVLIDWAHIPTFTDKKYRIFPPVTTDKLHESEEK